jgi:hypothetical protein
MRKIICRKETVFKILDFLISIAFHAKTRPGGIPARNHKGERLLLYLGIIDILQSYRIRKKLEHTLKAIILDAVILRLIDLFVNYS